MSARFCRSFRLGPWVGARVALLRSPILRPGQFRYSNSFGNHLGAQHVRLRWSAEPKLLPGAPTPHRELEGFPRPRFLNQQGACHHSPSEKSIGCFSARRRHPVILQSDTDRRWFSGESRNERGQAPGQRMRKTSKHQHSHNPRPKNILNRTQIPVRNDKTRSKLNYPGLTESGS